MYIQLWCDLFTKKTGSLSTGYNFKLKERIKEKSKMCYRTVVAIAQFAVHTFSYDGYENGTDTSSRII